MGGLLSAPCPLFVFDNNSNIIDEIVVDINTVESSSSNLSTEMEVTTP
jgi:hypothetical protein